MNGARICTAVDSLLPPLLVGKQGATARSAAAPCYHKCNLSIIQRPLWRKGGISMTCTEEYKERIEYTFHAFCKVVIRNATINAARTRSRRYKREISLEYLTDEKHYPLGTADKYFQIPGIDEGYIFHLCGDTVILNNSFLAEALSRLPVWKQEMLYLSYFQRIPQREIGKRYGRSRSAAGYHIRKALRQLQTEMEGMAHGE